MRYETMSGSGYRTGRGDRILTFLLATGLLIFSLSFLVVSKHGFWPWGVLTSFTFAVAAVFIALRWNKSRLTIQWSPLAETLTVHQGRKQAHHSVSQLTEVQTVPCRARTTLWFGEKSLVLSHRIVGIEQFLERVRTLRPDLFPPPTESQDWAQSRLTAAFAGILGSLTAVMAVVSWFWQPGVGAVLLICAVVVFARTWASEPLGFSVRNGKFDVSYAIRDRHFPRRPDRLVEETYVAGGCVFYRVFLTYNKKTFILDERLLTKPLRTHRLWIYECLGPELSV